MRTIEPKILADLLNSHNLYKHAFNISTFSMAGDHISRWLPAAKKLGYNYVIFNTLLWSIDGIVIDSKLNTADYSKNFILKYIIKKEREQKLERILK